MVDAGCSPRFGSLVQGATPCLYRTRCLQRGFYIPHLKRALSPVEVARLQGMPVSVYHSLVESLLPLLDEQEKREDTVAAALGDAMSANVLMRVLARALMRARMWPKAGLRSDPWQHTRESKARARLVDSLFASASDLVSQHAGGFKRKATRD